MKILKEQEKQLSLSFPHEDKKAIRYNVFGLTGIR
jgi:hypothetical protein